jgi:hypothetical protein
MSLDPERRARSLPASGIRALVEGINNSFRIQGAWHGLSIYREFPCMAYDEVVSCRKLFGKKILEGL